MVETSVEYVIKPVIIALHVRVHALQFVKELQKKQVSKKCGQTRHNKATWTTEANIGDQNTEDNPWSVTEENNFYDDIFNFY